MDPRTRRIARPTRLGVVRCRDVARPRGVEHRDEKVRSRVRRCPGAPPLQDTAEDGLTDAGGPDEGRRRGCQRGPHYSAVDRGRGTIAVGCRATGRREPRNNRIHGPSQKNNTIIPLIRHQLVDSERRALGAHRYITMHDQRDPNLAAYADCVAAGAQRRVVSVPPRALEYNTTKTRDAGRTTRRRAMPGGMLARECAQAQAEAHARARRRAKRRHTRPAPNQPRRASSGGRCIRTADQLHLDPA